MAKNHIYIHSEIRKSHLYFFRKNRSFISYFIISIAILKLLALKWCINLFKDTERRKETEKLILNGYSIPENLNLKNPYKENSSNAVYVGLLKLDVRTLKTICSKNPNLNIHIFGDCLTKLDLWKLRIINKFFFYGFQPREKFLSYIKFADVAICPHKDWGGMKWAGFTTKYLNFMYYNLPIVSYLAGEESEFEGTGVKFATDADDFTEKVSQAVQSNEKVDSNIDFKFYSHDERKNEYKAFINSL